MNVAILSDIHSNSHALEACLQYALNQSVTAFLFLGDYVGEMAYPQKTMHRLYELQKQYNYPERHLKRLPYKHRNKKPPYPIQTKEI